MRQVCAGVGHDVYYYVFTSNWPYNPIRQLKVNDSDYSIPYLTRVAEGFGLGGRWAYRRSYSDNEWFGTSRAKAEDLLVHADAVFNVTGATRLAKEKLHVGRWVYVRTDPVLHKVALANGDESIRNLVKNGISADIHPSTDTRHSAIPTPIPTALTIDQSSLPYPTVPRVAVGEARAAHESKQAVFVDVRSAEQYAQNHIPGALSIPSSELAARLNELSKDQWLITYCT